jgi:hypothetical protein
MYSKARVFFSVIVIFTLASLAIGADLQKPTPAGGYLLRLGEFDFDPADGLPQLAAGWESSPADSRDLRLVQLHGPTRAATLDALRERDLEIVQYIHPFTYIVWGRTADLGNLSSLSAVRATTDFAPAFRVQPQWRQLGSAVEDVRVLLYRGANTDDVVKSIGRLGGAPKGRHVLNEKWEIAGFDLSGARIREAARIPGVYSIKIQPTDGGLRSEMSDQVNVNNVDAGNIAFPGYETWLQSVGLDGTGVIMANVDGGVQDDHPDLVNRLIGCTGDTCGGSSTSSHGTHTAGIMAADGASGTLDGFGFLRGLGVAPAADLVEQVYSPFFTQPGGMLKLMTDSSRNDAVLSGNSWGPSGSPQGYDDDTLQVDIGVRDADPELPGNQQFNYVLSFMNGNGGTSSQGAPDEAKNLFNIGSTKMQTGSGSQDPNINDVSANSAHGPALDGRTIPHMVAPGCQVDSTDSGSGYTLKCGTSMASPHVSGAVGLFYEYYRGFPDYVSDPSPALVKAAFLAVARDLAGNDDADGGTLGHPFDNKQGWGRMDLEAVVDPPANSVRYFDNPVLFNNTGEEWVSVVSPLDAGEPVRIMLVWTDAPGHGLGGSTPAWNNDLDLVVEVGANTYRGNNFGGDGFSISGGSADSMNNTEGVFLDTVPGGGVTIRVVAANINSDGVPGVGDDTDQDFALACYNCAVEPAFTLAVEPALREICAPDDTDYAIDIGQILGFDDPVTMSVGGVPLFASSSFTVNPVTPPGSSTLEITNTGSALPGSYALNVTGTSGSLQRSVGVDLRIDSVIPSQVTLTSPADGAIDVPVTPTLTWAATAQTMSYDVEIALDPGFSNVVYSASESDTSHAVGSPLGSLTGYYWRVRAHNGCGDGDWSAVFGFTTIDFPSVLLVDDDDNGPDVRAAYAEMLAALGVPYELWDTGNSDNEPGALDLAPFELVIWFTGDEFGGSAGPGSAGETALAQWLDTGRCLLLASQDYHYDRSLTSFMQSHLGVSIVDNDESQSSATGQGTVFGGLGPYSLSFPYTNYSDIVNPDGTAEVAFDGSVGDVAISKASGVYLTSFLTFGLETLPTVEDRVEVLSTFMQACDAMPQPDSDQDGHPNDVDCAPFDPDTWSMPGPGENFRVARSSPFGFNLTWSAPHDMGGTGVIYDVLRSPDAADFGAAACPASGHTGPWGNDASLPGPGGVYYYMVRVNNACGQMTGHDSDDRPRPVGGSCN